MGHDLPETIFLLSRFPAALDGLLRDLPGTWVFGNEGENTWSPFDVVGHLIDAERTNWIPRIKTLLDAGEREAFGPFDRWAGVREGQGKSLARLLDEFAAARKVSLAALEALHLTDADLRRTGKHPAFGTVTLSELLATWAVHDLDHLHQISRVMAFQYKQAVGPWSEYLGVLKCAAHGGA